MTDNPAPKTGKEPKPAQPTRSSRPDLSMDQIIERIMKLLQHLLEKEARVGSSTPNRAVQEGAVDVAKPDKVYKEEVIGRLFRLISFLETTSAAFEKPKSKLARKLNQEAPSVVMVLLPGEIEELYGSDGPSEFREDEVAELAASIWKLDDDVRSACSELRRAVGGHYGAPPRGQRSEKRRGTEIAARLLGLAKGLGLKATTTKATKGEPGKGSAVEALTEAIRRTSRPSDPVAQIIYDQLPRGYESISKLNTALASDNVFRELSEIYERIGARPL
jgi:hypothetical protein